MKKLAVLGPAGSNGHKAANEMSDMDEYSIIWAKSNTEVMEMVQTGAAQRGVVPIWNNAEGFVKKVLSYWMNQKQEYGKRGLYPIAEKSIPINHCLLASKKARFNTLEEVHSHPQAIGQCREFLDSLKEPLLEKAALTTSGAAKMVSAHSNESMACIASEFAGITWGLKLIKKKIEDNGGNETTFHLISEKPRIDAERPLKTAIIFWVKNETGGLISPLSVITSAGRNMHTLWTIPLSKKKQVAFYVEFEGGVKNSRNILALLEEITDRIVVLGSFPDIV